MPCALCLRVAAAVLAAFCILTAYFFTLGLLPSTALARELANIDSPAWCAQHAPAAQAQTQCLRIESDCRAALPDKLSAGGCPSRELEACVARQNNGVSWCALLCCVDPDHPACGAAVTGMPQVFSQHKR